MLTCKLYSGLDSKASYEVIKYLKSVVRKERVGQLWIYFLLIDH